MAEVEAILNSRPLKNNEDQPHNEELLTPNQFLIQRPFSSLAPESFGDQRQSYFQELQARSAVDESLLARLAKGLPADSNQETEKNRQQSASLENWRYRLGAAGSDFERYLANWKSRGHNPWKIWQSTSCQGENGLGLVRASGLRPRTGFVRSV